jgi:hypothetical protein
MTTIQPTTTPLPPTAPAATGPVLVIPQPPPELARIEAGTALDVLVLARDRQPEGESEAQAVRTNAVLRTPAGDVEVRLPPHIVARVEEGARLAVEILKSGTGPVTARVTAIDGRPAAQVLNQPPAMPAPVPVVTAPALMPLPEVVALPVGSAWFAGKPVSVIQLQPLAGFVIAAGPSPATPQPGALPPFATGVELALRVTAITPPGTLNLAPALQLPAAATTTQQPTPGLAVAVAPGDAPRATVATQGPPAVVSPGPAPQSVTPPSVPAATPSAPVPNTPPPTPGLPASIAPDAPEPAAPLTLPRRSEPGPPLAPRPPTTIQPPVPMATVAGPVVAVTADEAPVVRTALGDVQLAVRANVPVGSRLTLDILAATPPRRGLAATPMAAPAGAALPLTALNGWPSLAEAIQVLQRADPQAAARLLQAIPDGGSRSAVAMMAFAHAMRTGDPRAWPGDAALRGLERAGPRGAQLAAQISGEVQEMAARAADTGGEWRTLPVPWTADGKIDRIALITRRESEGDDADDTKGKKRGGGTRFLINLDLSRLGEMQLDGMFRTQDRSFDMMVRTKDPLPPTVIRDLPGIFAASNAAMGLKGTLSFQVVKKFPDPAQGRPSPDRPGLWA